MAGVIEKANCAVPEQQDKVKARDPPAASPATERNQGSRPFAPQGEAWSPEAIKIFLNMWTHPNIQSMRAARKRRRAIYRMISRMLHNEGIPKSWSECRDMMVALENLYWTFQESNQNGQPRPFLYPFKEALERVFPFTWDTHGGSEREESESTDLDTSGAYVWNPIPPWTLPWHAAVQYDSLPWSGAFIAQGQNAQMMNSTLEPPPVIPTTFAYIFTQVPHWSTAQGPQSEIPWPPQPLIYMDSPGMEKEVQD
ncbi:uncharacterized protein LOC116420439 [Sarcophilus harrisii]|uniref:uncharacterized protein LOC116420439 n=1 Tax=Sarcophilus harrisii TaxID=9305 RepID=UPI001301F946|nr:uncharacterized protein LOC116420439 [Sarcophilus harrisii]